MKTIDENEMRQNQGFLEKFLVILVTGMTFGVVLLFGFVIVNPREEIVVLRFGKFVTGVIIFFLFLFVRVVKIRE